MSRAQYILYDVPKREKFNFPGLYEKGCSDAVQVPIEENQSINESSKNTVVKQRQKKEVKKKVLPFGTGKVL